MHTNKIPTVHSFDTCFFTFEFVKCSHCLKFVVSAGVASVRRKKKQTYFFLLLFFQSRPQFYIRVNGWKKKIIHPFIIVISLFYSLPQSLRPFYCMLQLNNKKFVSTFKNLILRKYYTVYARGAREGGKRRREINDQSQKLRTYKNL